VLNQKLKYRLFSCIVFLLCTSTYAQEKEYSLGVKGLYHYGFIMPHKTFVSKLVTGHTHITEVSFYKMTNGNKSWQQVYKHPKIGISFMSLNLANKENLGASYGIFPFIEFPINTSKIKWLVRAGYGIGYIENAFDRKENYKNLAIGSNLNALIYFNSQLEKRISKRVLTSFGLSLTHFSNGSYARPNLGINILSLNVGVSYSFGTQKDLVLDEDYERDRKWNKYIVTNVGLKEIAPIGGPKYMVSSTSFNMLKVTSNKSSFGFGADLFYNPTLPILIARDSISTTNFDSFRLGLTAIYALDIGKMSYQFQMGFYPYTKYKDRGYLYHRLVSRYELSDKLFINLGLKTHFAVADFIELGIGLKIH